MILRFKDILNEELLNNASVVFIFGDKPLFNNLISDKCRKKCENVHSEFEDSLIEEFSTEGKERVSINKVGIEQFKEVCYMPSLAGTWYCKMMLKELTEKDLVWLKKYIKNPSDSAILVIESTEYKEYRSWLKNRAIEFNKKVHIYQLSFPTRKELETIVIDKFRDRRVIVDKEAAQLVGIAHDIAKEMSDEELIDEYENNELYEETISNLVGDRDKERVEEWNLNMMKGMMSNIQHYNLDMLVGEILKGTSAKAPSGRVKVMKLLKYLEDEYGCSTLVSKIDNELNELIKYRTWINEGRIPVGIKYSVEEVKNKIDKNINIVTFKRRTNMASMVSLNDMILVKLIIGKLRYNPERCLFVIVCRYTLGEQNIKEIIA